MAKKTKKSKSKRSGSQPGERYLPATKQNLMLDMPSSHGGWPEGEYDPPVMTRISKWLDDMGMLDETNGKTYLTRRDIRNLVREILISETSMGRRLDTATNQISRSIVDVIKNDEIREKHAQLPDGGQLQLLLQDEPSPGVAAGVDSDLVDIDTVGNIVLFLEATSSELWTAGAYQYNPNDRSTSDLIIALGLPRNYELNILQLVIPEIKEAVRHELEHGVESTDVLQSMENLPEAGEQFIDTESMINFYTESGETAGHVTGLYKKAKDLKIPVSAIFDDYLTDVYQRAIASGMSEEDGSAATRKIAEIWYDYLLSRYPEASKHLK